MLFVSSAKANFLEYLFPSLKKEYDPYQTLRAPFAQEGEGKRATTEDFVRGLEDNSPLNERHRTTEIIASWAMNAAPQVIGIKAKNFDPNFSNLDDVMNDTAKRQFAQFLTDNKIMQGLQDRKFDINAFVKESPDQAKSLDTLSKQYDKDPIETLNEGVVSDRYRWAFRVPMVLSLLESGVSSYKNAAPENYIAVLTIQVGR